MNRNSRRARASFSVVTLAGVVVSVATAMAAEGKAMVLRVDPAPLVAETSSGETRFKVEIADDAAERTMGLMFRDYMPADQGMLFVFERTQPVGFWINNTPLPLDLIFIGDDGRVKAVRRGEPLSEAVIAPDAPVRFVLELNAGTAAAKGIEDGALMHHPEIEAVTGEGAHPSDGSPG